MLKYVFILLAIIFVADATLGHVFHRKFKNEGKNFKGILQIIVVLTISVMGNCILFDSKKDLIFIVFLFMELFYFLFLLTIFPIIYKKCDRLLLNDVAFLLCTGMLMISRLDTSKFIRQYIIVCVGTMMLLLIPYIVEKHHKIIELTWVYGLGGLGLLMAVFLLGKTVFGANLSISLFGITFQPSEFVKLSYIIFAASMLSKSREFKQVCITTAVAAAHVLVLALSNDLGTGMIFYVTYTVMLYDATHKKRYLFASGIAASTAGIAALMLLNHAKTRVIIWKDPFAYISGKGYQVCQSLFAIGSGGWFGSGFTKGLPGSIPVVTKDFIFPAISEEFGAIYAICLLLVCLSLFITIVTNLAESNNLFNRYVLGGFGIMYIFQTFLNVGGNINAIPSTGVTLPFVSYGGSSMTSLLIMVSIIQGIVAKNYDDEESKAGLPSPRMVIGSVGLILFLLVSFMVKLITFDETLLDSSYNRRLSKMPNTTTRGNIISSDGKILATTITVNGEEVRYYPYGRTFSHIIGYLGVDGTYAGSGLEQTLSYKLLHCNEPFSSKLYAEITGGKYHGNNVTTTLDAYMTEAASKSLSGIKGSVVVMDTKGAILAMVSYPDYDPNNIDSSKLEIVDGKIVSDNYLNRATQTTYTPGSIFKIVTLLAYYRQCLIEGGGKFYNFYYDCAGAYVDGDINIGCVRKEAHGHVDTLDAFAHSCNGAFIKMGLEIPYDKLLETANNSLLNCDVYYHDNFGIETIKSSFVLAEDDDTGLKLRTYFGQGDTRVTTLYNALLLQAVANKGVVYEPYFVSSIDSYNGRNIYSYDGSTGYNRVGQIMTEAEANMLKLHLVEVVRVGFSHVFGDCQYTSAGKSGTAQYGYAGLEHSLYAGYMPVKDPEIIVSVILEGFNENGEPDKYAVDIAKEIFDAWYNRDK